MEGIEQHSNNIQQEKQQIEKKDNQSLNYWVLSTENVNFPIIINSNFDSGNITFIKSINYQFFLSPKQDSNSLQLQNYTKSWFYFSIKGIPKNTKTTFNISKVNVLWIFYNSKQSNQYYAPVYRQQNYEWKRLMNQSKLYINSQNQLILSFDYIFQGENIQTFFAFSYPFEYGKCQNWLKQVVTRCKINNNIYSNLQIISITPQNRNVYLFTLSSYQGITNQKQSYDNNKILFPYKNQEERPFKFKNSKPNILITSRVHPGETPSSYSLQGMVQFLLSKDLRAKLLLKFFVFKIIPMLNPDGVYNGYYRMDIYNNNLNRFYLNPCPIKQPSIFAVKFLIEMYNEEKSLAFYFDLHSHPSKKGCFIYGNAVDDFVEQVETQVFCKLVDINTHSFQYQNCNFSVRHMNAKDRYEQLTKKGCGRVVVYKTTGVIYSYTLQLGYFYSSKNQDLPQLINDDFKVGQYGLLPDQIQQNSNQIYKKQQPPYYTIDIYKSVGKSLLVSILDTFQKNPFSRLYNSNYKSLENLRRMTAIQVFHDAERFRMFQVRTYSKVKNINQLIEQNMIKRFCQKKIIQWRNDPQLISIEWPNNVNGFIRRQQKQLYLQSSKFKNKFKSIKRNTIQKNNTCDSSDESQIKQEQQVKYLRKQKQDLKKVYQKKAKKNKQQQLNEKLQKNREISILQLISSIKDKQKQKKQMKNKQEQYINTFDKKPIFAKIFQQYSIYFNHLNKSNFTPIKKIPKSFPQKKRIKIKSKILIDHKNQKKTQIEIHNSFNYQNFSKSMEHTLREKLHKLKYQVFNINEQNKIVKNQKEIFKEKKTKYKYALKNYYYQGNCKIWMTSIRQQDF